MNVLPTYQQFMEPCLQALTGSGLMSKTAIIQQVSDLMGLTEEQRQTMLESGKATIARSRISWALAYLKQAETMLAEAADAFNELFAGEVAEFRREVAESDLGLLPAGNPLVVP